MLKYDHQLTEVKSRLPGANRILIILPQNLNTDNLAAGLSLYLSLKSSGKKVDVVSTGTPVVSQSNLFGIGDIRNDVSKGGAGNFIISLDGVVDTTGTMQQVPALEKLDWYPEGSKLNLVFHVVPGQRFEPTNITSAHEESGYDLTWVIGCQSLNELGNLFISNSQYFAQSQVINIDINPLNSYFGFANVIDPQASSLSEIIAHVLPSLTLNMDRDIASNVIAGIYGATDNLTRKINPDTFMVVSQAVQVGGILPGTDKPFDSSQDKPVSDEAQQIQEQQPEPVQVPQSTPSNIAAQPQFPEPPQSQPINQPSLAGSPFIVPPQDINIPMPAYQPEPQISQPFDSAQGVPPAPQPQFQFNNPPQSDNQAQPFDTSAQGKPVSTIPQANATGFDLRQIFQIPQMPSGAQTANSGQTYQPVGGSPDQKPDAAKSSSEERPMGEQAYTPSPEIETPTPDWLVPKIFRGGNLG